MLPRRSWPSSPNRSMRWTTSPGKHFIPIHGEFRMQVQHGRLAIETGVPPENVFIIENGQPIEILEDGSARRGQPVPAGYVFVDGLSVGEAGESVLRDR